MTFDEIALEEQEHIIDELQKENKRLYNVIDVKDAERIKLVKENKELHRRIDDLQSELVSAGNDYKHASNEIKLINQNLDRQLTVVDNLTEIAKKQHDDINKITEENRDLKLRLKMITKGFLNCIYGLGDFCFMDKDSINDIACYMDTDSIKETKDNDDNN